MKEFENKVITFTTALQDVYKDEESRELHTLQKLNLFETDATEDFTAMLVAQYCIYTNSIEDDTDLIGFTHILNKLAIQYINKK